MLEKLLLQICYIRDSDWLDHKPAKFSEETRCFLQNKFNICVT